MLIHLYAGLYLYIYVLSIRFSKSHCFDQLLAKFHSLVFGSLSALCLSLDSLQFSSVSLIFHLPHRYALSVTLMKELVRNKRANLDFLFLAT